MAIPTTTAYAEGALQGFIDVLAPLTAFATDFSAAAAQKGETVKFPIVPTQAAGNFAGNYTTDADNAITERTITLNIHKYKTVSLTDTEFHNSVYSNIFNLGVQTGAAVGVAFFEAILAAVTAANYGAAAYTGGAAGFDSDDVVDIKDVCDTALMPRFGRSLILSPAYYNALLKDPSIKNATNYGSAEGIQMGMIPSLSGFRTYEATSIPGNSQNLVGFASVPAGLGVAMRYLAPQDSRAYLEATPMTDSRTGMTLGVRRFVLPETGTHYLTVEAVGGSQVGIAEGIKRIISA